MDFIMKQSSFSCDIAINLFSLIYGPADEKQGKQCQSIVCNHFTEAIDNKLFCLECFTLVALLPNEESDCKEAEPKKD